MRNCWEIHLLGKSIVVANPHYAVRRYISVGGKNDDGFQFTPLGVIFNAILHCWQFNFHYFVFLHPRIFNYFQTCSHVLIIFKIIINHPSYLALKFLSSIKYV